MHNAVPTNRVLICEIQYPISAVKVSCKSIMGSSHPIRYDCFLIVAQKNDGIL